MKLLPPAPDKCQECGVKHLPDQAHDATSLYYQYNFYGKNGRWPTWSDAIEHLNPEWRVLWIQELEAAGVKVN